MSCRRCFEAAATVALGHGHYRCERSGDIALVLIWSPGRDLCLPPPRVPSHCHRCNVYYPRAKGQGVNPYSKADHKQDPSDSNSQMWLIDTIKPRAIHLLLIRILHTSAKAPTFSSALALKLLLRLLVQTSSSPECTEADPCLGISVPPSRASTSHVDVPW